MGGGARCGLRFVLMGGEWWESALNYMLVACWAGGGGEARIDMMVALWCVWRARRVEGGWGEGRAH